MEIFHYYLVNLHRLHYQSINLNNIKTQFSLNFASSSGQRRDVTCVESDGRCTNGLAVCLTLTDQGTPGPHLVISFPHSWSLSRWLCRETTAMVSLCSIAQDDDGACFLFRLSFINGVHQPAVDWRHQTRNIGGWKPSTSEEAESASKITRNAIDTNKANHIILGMLVLADALK